MKVIKDIKRQVIKNLKTILAPHLWRSGYQGTMIFAFAPLDLANRERNTRSMGQGVFNRDLTCCQGFYSDGVIDAYAGGCACYPFEQFCVEDLLAIEKWMNNNFAKELERSTADRNRE